MPNIIQHKRSSTPGAVPLATGLSQGELGINIGDGKLYTKNSSNAIINLGVTSISGTYITPASGNFSNYLAVNGTGVSLSSHTHSSFNGLSLGSSNITDNLTINVPAGYQVNDYVDNSAFKIINMDEASTVFSIDGYGTIQHGSIDASKVTSLNDTISSQIPTTIVHTTGNQSISGVKTFSSLPFVNGTGISISGHTHSSSDITNFNSAISGLLPTIANSGDNRLLTSTGSTVGINAESNLTFNGSLLAVSGNLVANTGTINSLNFNNIGDPDLSIRQLAWNNSEGSLAVGLSDTYEMFLGGELHYRVRNNTGSSILAGTAVYATGLTPGGNNRIEIAPKAADGSIREVRFMGLVTENIDNGVNGFTTHFGYIRNIDTRGDYAANGATNKVWASGEPVWAEGDILYIHPTAEGKLTKIEPKHSISVAIILNRHQNQGKLFVRPTSYGHLDDNHDVNVSGATNGQFLQYNSSTDYWVPSSSGNFTSLTVSGIPLINGGYDYEIHVSQIDGNDTTGNGDLLNPVASITKALTLVGSQRKTIIVHPGTYTENPSITVQYTTITGPGLIGGNILLSGTLSTNTGCTIAGIKMTNLTIATPTGAGNVNILNCEISGTLTKSSNADYTVLRLCDYGSASITGAGLVAIFGGNPNFTTVNNASANIIIKSAVTVAPVLTSGTLSLVDSIVVAAVTNAITSASSSVITLANCQMLTSALSNVAPVVLSGFYSILNCVFDKPNSTLIALSATGGPTNSIDYFQYINADKFITQGGTSSQYVKGDGSLALFPDNIVYTSGNQTISGVKTFSDLPFVNGTGVSISGHTHTSSNITDFNSSVSGLLPANLVTGSGVTNHIPYWDSASGLLADSNQLIWDSTNNRLGIGTTTPSGALHVIGTGIISSILGIGTNTPVSNFHIAAASDVNYGNILVSGTNASTHIGLGGISDTVPFLASLSAGTIATSINGFGMFYRNTDGDFTLSRKSGSTSWIRSLNIQRSNGFVGIGSGTQAIAPPEMLTVDGNLRLADKAGSVGNKLQFNRGGGTANDYTIGKEGNHLGISTSNDSSTFRFVQFGYHSGSTWTPRTVINGFNGNVGIGTISPDAASRLTIVGSGNTSASAGLSILNSSSTNLLYVRDDGNIGIGTITPTSKLHVAGDILATGSFIGGSGTAALPSFEFVNDPDTGLFSPSANTIGLATSGVERLRINNIGSVGIGTTSPETRLNVDGTFLCGTPGNGGQGLYVDPGLPLLRFVDTGPNYVADIDVNGLTLYGSASSPFFYTDRNNARIGIGTDSPSSTLQVSGLITANSGIFDNISFTSPILSSGSLVSFTHPDNSGSSVYDTIISGQLHITRGANGGIYNLATEASWNQSLSPSGTLWNNEGWSNLVNFKSRTYSVLYSAVGGQLGYNLPNAELIMKHVPTNRYWKVKFTSWTQGGGGGFDYERQEIFVSNDDSVNINRNTNIDGNLTATLLSANSLSTTGISCQQLSVNGADLTYGGQSPSINLKGYTWFGKTNGSLGVGVNDAGSGTFGSTSPFHLFTGFNENVSAYNSLCFTAGYFAQVYMDTNGNVGINTATPTVKLDVDANTMRLRTSKTISSASATGAVGEICWDSNYIYVCVATNTWKRTSIATW
jgi:hypothetical protein